MLKFINVTKKYNHLVALDDISFDVGFGEIIGLIGANGAGKTTAIEIVTGYIKPDYGEVCVDNIESIKQRSAIAYIPDEPVYYEFMTVAEHLEFISSMYSNGEYSVEEIIKRFSLEDQLDKMPHTLSKGNKQKLMIATALLREFKLLIADEPFTGLDPKQINVLKCTLSELKAKGKGVLISTHLLDVIELFCDRYIMIEKGRIIGQGSKIEIARHFGLDNKLSIEEMYITVADNNGKGVSRYEKDAETDSNK